MISQLGFLWVVKENFKFWEIYEMREDLIWYTDMKSMLGKHHKFQPVSKSKQLALFHQRVLSPNYPLTIPLLQLPMINPDLPNHS